MIDSKNITFFMQLIFDIGLCMNRHIRDIVEQLQLLGKKSILSSGVSFSNFCFEMSSDSSVE